MNDGDFSLLARARTAAETAYCPYSRFRVGAALEAEDGQFVGCNVENASYSLGICAERVAICTAVAAGSRTFKRLAVSCLDGASGDASSSKMPCGACRQVIAEHFPGSAEIIIDGVGVWTVDELMPEPFRLPQVS